MFIDLTLTGYQTNISIKAEFFHQSVAENEIWIQGFTAESKYQTFVEGPEGMNILCGLRETSHNSLVTEFRLRRNGVDVKLLHSNT